MSVTTHSFDVFDTALVRTWARPADLFVELGHILATRGIITLPEEDFAKARMQAEVDARVGAPCGECSLHDIYRILASKLGWAPEVADTAAQQEMDLEGLALRPVPQISARVSALRAAGKKVVFLSDMYLPGAFIAGTLARNGYPVDESSVLVSNECQANKATGTLFNLCLQKFGGTVTQLAHEGDNADADVRVPQSLGISAASFADAHLSRYEAAVADLSNVPRRPRSFMAGASRRARLAYPPQTGDTTSRHDRTIWNVACDVAGPVLFSFVWYCLQEARASGVRRLYFLARDGQILHRIATQMCDRWGYQIECRYLYASRQAWHLPATLEMNADAIEWIMDPTQHLSVRSALARAALSPEDLRDALERGGFASDTWDMNLSAERRAGMTSLLMGPDLRSAILIAAARSRETALSYLKQEGLTDDQRFAIVDIGWNGRLQRSLGRILASADAYPAGGTIGMYFGLSQRRKAFPEDDLRAFLLDQPLPKDRAELANHRGLFELFVAADHGSVTGYTQRDGRHVPVLRTSQNELALEWGLRSLQAGVEAFVTAALEVLEDRDWNRAGLEAISQCVLCKFYLQPSKDEAEAFGDYKFYEDQAEDTCYTLAPRYSLSDAVSVLFSGRPKHHNTWMAGTLARTGVIPGWLIRHYNAWMVRGMRRAIRMVRGRK